MIPSRPIEIVVLGPMKGISKPDGKVAYRDHIDNMTSAVKLVVNKIDFPSDVSKKVRVWNHLLEQTNSTEKILLRIDQCDLAIVDVSSRSANVLYELAFINAIGKKSIVLDIVSKRKVRRKLFYIDHNKVNLISGFSVSEIYESIRAQIENFLKFGKSSDLDSNPITSLYDGSSVADYSAASGLVIGLFYNYISFFVADSGIIATRSDIRKIVVVRPPSLQSLVQVTKLFKESIQQFGERVAIPIPGRHRDVFNINIYKDIIVEYPTPIESMLASARYKKIELALKSFPDEEAKQSLRKMQENLMDTFFQELWRHVSGPGYNRSLMAVWTSEQVIDYLSNGIEPPDK